MSLAPAIIAAYATSAFHRRAPRAFQVKGSTTREASRRPRSGSSFAGPH